MKNPSGPLRPYQVLATIVGINLIFVFTAAFAQRMTDDTSWWNRNETTIFMIDQIHGLLFMVLLVLIALLATRNKWKPAFTITTMLLATVPFVSFYAERRTTKAVRASATS